MTDKKALIVEDTDHNRMLMRTILEIEHFDVIEKENGTGVVDVVKQEKPDIILMDIQLPDISGTELIRILKQQDATKHIPIIAITAFAMPQDRERILGFGCEEYMAKPFATDELIALLRKYVKKGG